MLGKSPSCKRSSDEADTGMARSQRFQHHSQYIRSSWLFVKDFFCWSYDKYTWIAWWQLLWKQMEKLLNISDFRSGTTGIFQKSQKFCPGIQQFCPLKIEQKQRFPKNSKACNHCNYRLCWRIRWDSNPRALADNRISSFLCNWYMWWYCWSLEVILSAIWCCKNQSITALKGEDPLKIQWVRSQLVFAPFFDLWAELRAESGRTKLNGNT